MNLSEAVALVTGFLDRAEEDGVREEALHVLTSKQSAACASHWEECGCSPIEDVMPGNLTALALAFVGLASRTDEIGDQARQLTIKVLQRVRELEKRATSHRAKENAP